MVTIVLSLPTDSPIIARELDDTNASLCELLDCSNVMSCNVGQYLPTDDSPVKETEYIVHLKMIAQQGRRRGRGRGRFLPPQSVEFIINTKDAHTLHLTGWCNPDVEECKLALHHGREVLRKFHAHDGHKNPKGWNYPTARLHMHFPSTKYPLIAYSSSYAYSIDSNGFFNDMADCVQYFCMELDIDMNVWQPYLIK